MMTSLAQYILRIACGAILCAIMKSFTKEKGGGSSMAAMLCGVFLALTVLSPLRSIKLPDIGELTDSFTESSRQASAMGTAIRKQQLSERIKYATETYICDKANSLQAQLQVEVTLSDEDIPKPVAVRLSGSVSPYAKTQLQRMMEQELGIAKENQLWI